MISRAIYHAAQSPPMDVHASGWCRVCGSASDGVLFADWIKDTFTDHDKLLPGTIVCQACQFCSSEKTPGLQERVGKDKPQKFRNYSHFVKDGVWYPLSKGNKAVMRSLLFDHSDVAIIAESGQKHLFFRAKVGWWQFEEATLRPFPDLLALLLDSVERLYQGGISKSEIETGRYSGQRIAQVGMDTWLLCDGVIKPYRGGIQLALALFLAQKDDDAIRGLSPRTEHLDSVMAGDTSGLQAEICTKHLGSIREPDQERGLHQHDQSMYQQSLFTDEHYRPGR